jgi:hypothetical protein
MDQLERHFWKVIQQDAGARHYKVDLHIHTPSSSDQKYGYSQKDAAEDLKVKKDLNRVLKLAGQILDRLVAEEISVAAFTDHNTPGYVSNADAGSLGLSWYQLVKEEYERRRDEDDTYPKLLLLPGVEITTDRIHILGIFDNEDDFAIFKIASLLRSVDIRENEFGKVLGVFGTKSIWEVADAIDELGGICIPAHINKNNMRSLLGQYRPPDMEIERLVQHRAIHVFGVVPPKAKDWRDERSYRSILENMGRGDKRTKAGYHSWMVEKRAAVPQHLPDLGYMMNSDAHSIAKIGDRFSWVKMDDLSFRSLSSALRNPAYCIHDSRIKPVSSVRSQVLGVSVQGGFADRLCVRFNEHFNCIVAGPGTGKTTLMHVIQDTFRGNRLGLRVRDETERAINNIADGLWEEIKGREAFTEQGLPRRKLPEKVRRDFEAGFLEMRGDLPWTIFVFFSQVQEDGSKVIYAAERRRLEGIEGLDGAEDLFRYYQSNSQPADLDRIKAIRFTKIGEGHSRKSGSALHRMLARPNFRYGGMTLGAEDANFPGARFLLDTHLLRVMDGYSDTRTGLFRLCRQLEKAAEKDHPDAEAIATHAAAVRQALEDMYALRVAFAKRFNETELEHALRMAFHKGRWQQVVAAPLQPAPKEVADYVHNIRLYLHGQDYYDELALTFYQKKKKRGAGWDIVQVPFSQLQPGRRSLMALRLLLNSSWEMAPVFIDCPERWLDNETLVSFCDMRRHRDDQLIFFTQNPNIAVLGHAEQTIILDVDEGRTRTVAVGGLGDEKVAGKIIALLEGGNTAFQRKLLQYQTELRRMGIRVELQRPGKT